MRLFLLHLLFIWLSTFLVSGMDFTTANSLCECLMESTAKFSYLSHFWKPRSFRKYCRMWSIVCICMNPSSMKRNYIWKMSDAPRYERKRSHVMITGKYLNEETFRDHNALGCSALFIPTAWQYAFPLCTIPLTLEPENLINISNIKKRLVRKKQWVCIPLQFQGPVSQNSV